MIIGCIKALVVSAINPMFRKAASIAGPRKYLANSRITSIEQPSMPNASKLNPEVKESLAANLVSNNIHVISVTVLLQNTGEMAVMAAARVDVATINFHKETI
jgi:hypothetical protein